MRTTRKRSGLNPIGPDALETRLMALSAAGCASCPMRHWGVFLLNRHGGHDETSLFLCVFCAYPVHAVRGAACTRAARCSGAIQAASTPVPTASLRRPHFWVQP